MWRSAPSADKDTGSMARCGQAPVSRVASVGRPICPNSPTSPAQPDDGASWPGTLADNPRILKSAGWSGRSRIPRGPWILTRIGAAGNGLKRQNRRLSRYAPRYAPIGKDRGPDYRVGRWPLGGPGSRPIDFGNMQKIKGLAARPGTPLAHLWAPSQIDTPLLQCSTGGHRANPYVVG
jgi:hypothetical protein